MVLASPHSAGREYLKVSSFMLSGSCNVLLLLKLVIFVDTRVPNMMEYGTARY